MKILKGLYKFFISLFAFIKDEHDDRQKDFDEYRIRFFDPSAYALLRALKANEMTTPKFVTQYDKLFHDTLDVFGAMAIVFENKERLVVNQSSVFLYTIYSDMLTPGCGYSEEVMVIPSEYTGMDFKELRMKITTTTIIGEDTLALSFYLDSPQDLLGLDFEPVSLSQHAPS